MKQEDKLKNALREYYDNQEVPYDANEWERASAYLAKERKGNARKKLAFILLALLGVSIVLFKIVTPQNAPKQLATERLGQDVQSSTEEHQVAAAGIPQAEIADSKNKNKTKSQELRLTNSTNESPEVFNTAIESNTTEARSVKETGLAKSSAPITKVENQIPAIEKYPGAKVEPAKEIAEIEPELIKEKDEDEVPASLGLAVETEEQPDVESEAKSTIAKNDNSASTEKVTENEEDEKTNPAEKQAEPIKEESQSSPVAEQKQSAEEKSNVSPASEEKLPSTSVASSPATGKDSESTSEMTFVDTLVPSYVPISTEGVFYELGAAGYYGWKTPVKRDAQGFSPLLGINYMNRLSRKTSVSFGVQYLQVGNLSASSKVSRISTYKYGEQSKVTMVTPTTLHYIVAPLRFHYFIDQKNVFGGGVNLAYLLNVVSKVTTYDEKPGLKENYSTVKLSGYTEGFSWYDSQLAVFYRRKFLNTLALQAEVFVGLTDIKQDAFFALNAKERNSGLKLSLIYFAFKKDKR